MRYNEVLELNDDLFKEVYEKYWSSADFREELNESPKEILEKTLKTEFNLEQGTSICINDQTGANKYYLNIPRERAMEKLELTDEEMDVVTGGEIAVGILVLGGITLLAGTIAYGYVSTKQRLECEDECNIN